MYTQSVVGQVSNCNSKAALCRPLRYFVDLHRSERVREYTEEHRNVRSEILSVVLLRHSFDTVTFERLPRTFLSATRNSRKAGGLPILSVCNSSTFPGSSLANNREQPRRGTRPNGPVWKELT
jgi:hypothetical protein